MNEREATRTDAVDVVSLYRTHVVAVYSYLHRRCGDRSVAEELTAETFEAAVNMLQRRPPLQADRGWLVGIARHKLVDHWRRREREARSLRSVARDEEAADDDALAALEPARAERALAALPVRHRAILVLRYLDGLPVPDIATLLGTTVHSAESRLARARRALRAGYDLEQEWAP